jgi:hypothetical protein
MPYGDPLDSATPTDLDMAGQGDDRLRELKRALRARLGSFFVDVDANPLVPQPGSIPPATVFLDGTIPGTKLAVGSVPADRIIGGGGGGGLGPNTVSTSALQDGAVTNPKIADNAVDARTIAPGAVGASEMANDAVNTANLINGAVRREKMNADLIAKLVAKGSAVFQFPAATVLAPGDSWWDISTIVTTNLQTGGAVAVHMQPDLDYADSGLPAHWSDGIVMHGNIGLSGATLKLILRFHNASGSNRDVSSHFVWVSLFQSLNTTVTEP